MSSEHERRNGHYCGAPLLPCAREIIDFFKFPKATDYSIAKSFKESEDIEEGFLTPELPPTRSIWAKLVLRESRHVLVKGVLAPSSPDLNPCDYYLWGVLERDTKKRAHNTVDSLKAAFIQAVANLSREQVAHAVGSSGTVWRLLL
ncbi:Uncharacterized protein FKW44_010738 [Caligus rogercresseyi]|uniref:Uncharacterized protein n=1 Tax=Caligus rogercresseyi TaxID=217165 RepID=A0A7T8HH57_CALRO|nr:Uncharacterized protein FKW44_010738 [Caligus rogercresseyi]